MLTFTAVIEAGCIQQHDQKLMFIQGLSADAAGAVAEWLAAATNAQVCLRYIDARRRQDFLIHRAPSDAKWISLPNDPTTSPLTAGAEGGVDGD